MLSLSSLAGWEDAVLASVRGASGSLEEQDSQIERSGLYGEYPAIVNAYIELFADAESSLEALKRALYIVWRGAMDLPVRTGIPPLPDATSRRVLEELDNRLLRESGDGELAWMLAWYHAQGSFVLELYGATPRVMSLAESTDAEAWREAGITAARMAVRGQMGRYWAAKGAGA